MSRLKQVLAISLALVTVLSLASCKKDKADKAESDTSSVLDFTLPDFQGYKYVLMYDADGKAYLVDKDGNKIYADENGKFYDKDGNEILNYGTNTETDSSAEGSGATKDNTDDSTDSITVIDGNDYDPSTDPTANLTAEQLKEIIAKATGESSDDSVEKPYFDDKVDSPDYNPYEGSKTATQGTSITAAPSSSSGMYIKENFDFKNVSEVKSGNSITYSVTVDVTQDIQAYLDQYREAWGTSAEIPDEDADSSEGEKTKTVEFDFTNLIVSQTISAVCYYENSETGERVYADNSYNENWNMDGKYSFSFTINVDNPGEQYRVIAEIDGTPIRIK